MEKLSLFELKEGMVIGEPVFLPGKKELLLNQGTTLTKDLIASLKARGVDFVSINDRYTLLIDPADTIVKEMMEVLEKEISKFAPEGLEENTSDNMVVVGKRARLAAKKLSQSEILVNFCTRMKLINSNLLYKHGLQTCVYALLVSGAMGLNDEEMFTVGTAALLHDLGLCEMPPIIDYTQNSKQNEMAWKEHPKYGYYIAKENGISADACKIILHHHELWNGSGFPVGMIAENIPLGARIISVCETYDRLIRYEGYHRYQAIEYLYGSGQYYFDSNVVAAFTNGIAIYPLGSMVRLSTGETGIIVNIRKNLGPRPIIRVYYNRVNMPYEFPKYIDLGKERTVFIKEVL